MRSYYSAQDIDSGPIRCWESISSNNGRFGIHIFGSEQEFDKRPILCGFPKKHEFGLGDSHALSLEQQVA
jgi:hypothetical protein